MSGSAFDSAGRITQTIDSGHQSTITQIFLVNSVASVHVKSDLKECDINRTMTSPAQPPNTNDYPDQPMTLAAMDGFGDGGTNPDPFAYYSDQHGQVAGQPDPVADFAAANHDPSAMEAMLSHTHPVDMDLEGVQKKAGGGNTKVRATMVKSNVSDRGDDSCKSMPMRCQCPICLELHAMFGHRNSDATNDEEPAESLFSYSLSDDDAHGSHGDSPHVYDGCGPILEGHFLIKNLPKQLNPKESPFWPVLSPSTSKLESNIFFRQHMQGSFQPLRQVFVPGKAKQRFVMCGQ